MHMIKNDSITVVDCIGRKDFYHDYVDKGIPILIKGATKKWPAFERWNSDYFARIEDGLKLPIKTGNVAEGKREFIKLSDYTRLLDDFESNRVNKEKMAKPPYLHDVPIFHLLPQLIPDISPFPLQYFPNWYWEKWWNYIQFFMGPTGSLTPLHFDTLCTHNLFFQVVGSKKFILIPSSFYSECYLYNWRWSKVNPQEIDNKRFPLFDNVEVAEVIVGPGDLLYIPPGMLHQVHGLSRSVSFNIDWHTRRSALLGMFSLFRGAPAKNAYYNGLIFSGLSLNIPSKYIFPFYKSYLNYIS